MLLSQSKESIQWEADVEPGITKQVVTDKTFSSLPYSGVNFGGGTSVFYRTKKAQHSNEFYYSQGNLSNGFSGSGKIQVENFNIDYAVVFKFKEQGNTIVKYKAGAGIDVLNNNRKYQGYINNKQTRDFAASLKVACELSVHLNKYLKGVSITNRLHIPVVSVVGQPVYGADAMVVPAEENQKKIASFMENLRILSFPSFLRIKNQFLISKKVSSKQVLSLSYTIDYLNIQHFRNVQQNNHRFSILYAFRF